MNHRKRFTAVEYSQAKALLDEIARETGLPIHQVRELLLNAGERAQRSLDLKTPPISWNADRIHFQNLSGILLLTPGLEIEIAPKFLGNSAGWREDFFLLAAMSHHGRLLDQQDIRSSARSTSDLTTLVGRSLVEMYWRNQRRPLKTYQRFSRPEYSIEGDFHPEDILLPSENGFHQEITSFTRNNSYNATIGAAARRLAPLTPDLETRSRLERLGQHLPRDPIARRIVRKTLPSRAKAWQPTYNLALDVLRGYGGAYDSGDAFAPGFIMQTWQAWESLINYALKLSFGANNVSSQSRHILGTKELRGKESKINVVPDGLIDLQTPTGNNKVLVDAKYKGNIERGKLSVSNADVYEALAFSTATDIRDVVLLYPKQIEEKTPNNSAVGDTSMFASIEIGDTRIKAFEVGICGIAKKNGIKYFSNSIKAICLDAAEQPQNI